MNNYADADPDLESVKNYTFQQLQISQSYRNANIKSLNDYTVADIKSLKDYTDAETDSLQYYRIAVLKTDIENLTENNIDKYACQAILYSLVAAWLKYKNNSVKCFLEYNVCGKTILQWLKSFNPNVKLHIEKYCSHANFNDQSFEKKNIYNEYHIEEGCAKLSAYANDVTDLARKAANLDTTYFDKLTQTDLKIP
jgi:hypothetical protein